MRDRNSTLPSFSTPSISSTAKARMRGSIFVTAPGEKEGLRMRRMSVCTGGSYWFGAVRGVRCRPTFSAGSLEKISHLRSMSTATEERATIQWPPLRGVQKIGGSLANSCATLRCGDWLSSGWKKRS
jgi:hypothetical protein